MPTWLSKISICGKILDALFNVLILTLDFVFEDLAYVKFDRTVKEIIRDRIVYDKYFINLKLHIRVLIKIILNEGLG